MTNIIAQIVEMELHTLQEEEQTLLLDLLRAGKSLVHSRRGDPPPSRPVPDPTLNHEPTKETFRLMAANQTTDDQVFTQVFEMTDNDGVPVDSSNSPVTVAVVDSTGADVSKWIDVKQDSANPLKFVYSRKQDDGTQPAILDFTSVGTATIAGAPQEFRTDFEFTPGAAVKLTSTVTTGAPEALTTDAGAGGGDSTQEQTPNP